MKIKKVFSWIGVLTSLTISSFWAYWGIQEFFHEGWHSSSCGNLIFLFLVQYLSFTIIFTALAFIAMKYKKIGLILYILVGIFSIFFFNGASFEVVYLTLAIPFILLGLLFYYGEFVHKKIIRWFMIGLPLLIIVSFGLPLLIRNINRLDDGNYNARILDCQGKQIVWAPRGYGFPDEGVNWSEAKEACSRLSEDGQILLEAEVNIWRLPSVEEAVKCQQKHGKNALGVWNEQDRQASYKLTPDKETPLWQPDSEIVYYWTSEISQETEGQAYIFTYDGGIYDKDIRYAPNFQSFRCVKDYVNDRKENNLNYFFQRDKVIEEYLLKQKEFIWQTVSNTKNACVFENLGDKDSLFPLSLWVLCQEYKIVDGKVEILSGVSGPVLINYPNELSYFSINEFAHQAPRDGKLYYEDIQNIFPKSLHNTIYTYNNQDFLAEFFKGEVLNQAQDIFIFQGEDNQEMKDVLKKSFAQIKKMFGLDFSEKIEVFIYSTQTEFWVNTFPNNKNNGRTTGLADYVNKKIYLTSISDTSIKSREEMLKVPVHELIHVLLPHPWIEIREGLAVYLADQILPYESDDIPDNLSNIIDYSGKPEDTLISYSFAGLKIKFIIEECLDYDYQKFLEFISNPDKELDYLKIGYDSERLFLEGFRKYLLK